MTNSTRKQLKTLANLNHATFGVYAGSTYQIKVKSNFAKKNLPKIIRQLEAMYISVTFESSRAIYFTL